MELRCVSGIAVVSRTKKFPRRPATHGGLLAAFAALTSCPSCRFLLAHLSPRFLRATIWPSATVPAERNIPDYLSPNLSPYHSSILSATGRGARAPGSWTSSRARFASDFLHLERAHASSPSSSIVLQSPSNWRNDRVHASDREAWRTDRFRLARY
jgi:hypothetical protein